MSGLPSGKQLPTIAARKSVMSMVLAKTAKINPQRSQRVFLIFAGLALLCKLCVKELNIGVKP